MTTRLASSPIFFALAVSFAFAPVLSQGQTPAAADSSSTAAAPATPEAPAAPATPAPATPVTAPAAAPVAPADTTTSTATPEERPTTYTMVTGDSLDSVAKKFDTSIHALAKLNHIPKSKYRKLRAGKVLQIPPATK
jgi:LysM repeat protein